MVKYIQYICIANIHKKTISLSGKGATYHKQTFYKTHFFNILTLLTFSLYYLLVFFALFPHINMLVLICHYF